MLIKSFLQIGLIKYLAISFASIHLIACNLSSEDEPMVQQKSSSYVTTNLNNPTQLNSLNIPNQLLNLQYTLVNSSKRELTYQFSLQNNTSRLIENYQWSIETDSQIETVYSNTPSITKTFSRSINAVTINAFVQIDQQNFIKSITISPSELINIDAQIRLPNYLVLEPESLNPLINNNTFNRATKVQPPIAIIGQTQDTYNPTNQSPQDIKDYYRIKATGNELIYFKGEQFNTLNHQSIYRVTLYNSLKSKLTEQFSTLTHHNIDAISIQIPNTAGIYYLLIEDIYDNDIESTSSGQYLIEVYSPTSNQNAFNQQSVNSSQSFYNTRLSSFDNEPPTDELLIQVHPNKKEATKKLIQPNFNILSNEHSLLLVKQKKPNIKKLHSHIEFFNNKNSMIKHIEPNYKFKKQTVNDSFFNEQWYLTYTNIPQTWSVQTNNASILALLDSGITSHSDMDSGKYIDGFDFIADTFYSEDGDGIDNNPADSAQDIHGLWMAGIISATSNNSIGIAGNNPHTKIMPLRVIGKDGVASNYSIIQALRYAAQYTNDSNQIPTEKADVINLSLGGYHYSSIQDELTKEIAQDNILIVASAGNYNQSNLFYPAAYNKVFAVSAVQINNQIASYSNYGSWISLAAPGGNISSNYSNNYNYEGIITLDQNNGFTEIEGTSPASAQVAAIFSLMKSLRPSLNYDEVNTALNAGLLTNDLGSPRKDLYFGNGVIDALKSVAYTSYLNQSPNHYLTTNINRIKLFSQSEAIIHVYSNTTNSPTNFTIDLPNLINITPFKDPHLLNQFSNYQQSYRITKKFNLTSGEHRLQLTISNSQYSKIIPISVFNSTNTSNNQNLPITVRLIPNDSRLLSYTVSATKSSSTQYSYQFKNIEPGLYFIQFGVDLNNDGAICHQWEPCGSYQSYLTLPKPISIHQTMTLSPQILNVNYQ